jgi:tripartite-type tricarboxylate transporter receptor subunit TctC
VGTVGLAVLRLVNKAFTLDLRNELQGVALLGSSPLVLAIGSKLPVQNIQEFIEFAKKNPGHLNYGSQGAVDVLASSAMASALDINTTTIRYSGGNFVKAALLSNDIHFSVFYSGDIAPLLSADKVRLIATTGKERHREYPDLPTIAEVSKTDYEYVGWAGLFVKTGTPDAIVNKLNAAAARTMQRADFKKRLLDLGYEGRETKPLEFGKYFADEIEKWSAIAAKTEFKPE